MTGDVTPQDRDALRSARVSFLTSDGAAELWWPNLRMSIRPTLEPTTGRRRVEGSSRTGLHIGGSHVRVVQILLDAHRPGGDAITSMQNLATRAAATPQAASKVLRKVQRHDLARTEPHEDDSRVQIPRLIDPLEVARVLRDNSALDTAGQLGAYVYGRDITERAASLATIADDAADRGHELVVTGLAAAATHGAVRTGIQQLDVWLRVPDGHDPSTWLMEVGIEPMDQPAGAPLRVGIDRTGAGTMGSVRRQLAGEVWIPTAQVPRIWVDLAGVSRGADIAEQLTRWEPHG